MLALHSIRRSEMTAVYYELIAAAVICGLLFLAITLKNRSK